MNRTTLLKIIDKLFKVLTKTTIENLEFLPAEGPALIVLNHVSYTDFPIFATQHRRDDWSAFITDKYKNNRFLQWVVSSAQLVWIDRTKADFAAIKAAFNWLQEGKSFALSPEGTRSKTNSLNQGKEGVAMIALKANVPIVPAAVIGTGKFFSDLKRLRRPTLTFRFGPPQRYGRIDPERRGESLREMTDDIMCRIAALLPDEMHGFYSGHPAIDKIRRDWRQQFPDLILPNSSQSPD